MIQNELTNPVAKVDTTHAEEIFWITLFHRAVTYIFHIVSNTISDKPKDQALVGVAKSVAVHQVTTFEIDCGDAVDEDTNRFHWLSNTNPHLVWATVSDKVDTTHNGVTWVIVEPAQSLPFVVNKFPWKSKARKLGNDVDANYCTNLVTIPVLYSSRESHVIIAVTVAV